MLGPPGLTKAKFNLELARNEHKLGENLPSQASADVSLIKLGSFTPVYAACLSILTHGYHALPVTFLELKLKFKLKRSLGLALAKDNIGITVTTPHMHTHFG